MHLSKLIPLLICVLLKISCTNPPSHSSSNSNQPSSSSKPLFNLLPSSKTGIDFVNLLTEDVYDDTKNILSFEYYFNGAGVAIGDINQDELPDIFFVGNEVPNRLYLNKGNLQFEDISKTANINIGKTWATGVTMVDINEDGLLDIYVCQSGPKEQDWELKKNLLYINNGDLTFTESAVAYGLADTNMSTQAAFFDYDKDGDLDCFVLNESKYTFVVHKAVFEDLKKKENLDRASSHLYRNDNGHFTKVTESAGMLRWGFGLGLGISDFNQDGWPDVYVANDYSVPDFMYINNRDGTFTEQVKEMTKQVSFYSMGMDIADINNDGYQDIAVVDMAADDHVRDKTLMASMDSPTFWYYINTRQYQYQYMFNTLQLNNRNSTYSNIAHLAGVARSDWSWAALLADFDNDGYKDFFVTNGYRRYARDNDFRLAMQQTRAANGGRIPMELRQKMYDKMPSIKLANRMYKNEGELQFTSVEKEWGLPQASYSNGAAYADLDVDGDLDLVVNNVSMEAFVYENQSRQQSNNNYLRIRLKGNSPETPIANTVVTIHYDGNQQVQELMNTRGYASSVEETLHFGLGDNSIIDTITIKWLDGTSQQFYHVEANQQLIIQQNITDSSDLLVKEHPSLFFKNIPTEQLGVAYKHTENVFDDFQKQLLLPHKQSTLGPYISVADINSDGLDDFFIGGAAGQSGRLYIQQQDGTFNYALEQQAWEMDKACEDMGALFYDADGDGDLDLYVVSGGGGEFNATDPALNDRLYINMGGGKFQKVKQGLPNMPASGSRVKAADFDKDGDLDLFVGGRSIPGKYPSPSRSYLLEYDNFRYRDVTEEVAPELLQSGIITDFLWVDFNQDGQIDLVTVGEWMSLRFYKNNLGRFENVTEQTGLEEWKGWWNTIAAGDIDNDGDLDFIVGNLGLNSKYSANTEKPLNLFAEDFDQNGTFDIMLGKYYKEHLVPVRGKECSSEQMPFIKDKFPTYKEFASANLADILGQESLKKALHFQASHFESTVFINQGNGQYTPKPLPRLAQISPINSIVVKDMNGDSFLDLIIAGNNYDTEVETPRYDSGTGLVLIGDGTGQFHPVNSKKSGWFIQENVRDIALIKGTLDNYLIGVAINNEQMQFFKTSNIKEKDF